MYGLNELWREKKSPVVLFFDQSKNFLMGLVIPVYPPYVLDIRETVIMLAAFAGGPYVGIASGFLMELPSAIPVMDTWYYPGMTLCLCAVTKTAWKLIKEDRR